MRRMGRKVAIDLEMSVSEWGQNFPIISIARIFDGMLSGIPKHNKYFDQENQIVIVEAHNRVGVTDKSADRLACLVRAAAI